MITDYISINYLSVNYIIICLLFLILYILFYDLSESFENKNKTIIFSLTCHESVECIIDLINNIYKCFNDFNIYILISTTENINNQISKLNLNKNIIIISVRNDKHNIWGNIDLFYEHIKNIIYLKNNHIKYDYFWFIASNELFIKKIDSIFLEKNIIKNYYKKELSKKEVNNFYDNFLENKHDWYWYQYIKNDKYTINVLNENNIILHNGRHESLVLPAELALEIAEFYVKTQIHEKSFFRNYPMEELFVFSYLKSKYNLDNINTFCLIDNNTDIEDTYNKALNNNLIVSIKPVKRIYSDKLRVKIRNSL